MTDFEPHLAACQQQAEAYRTQMEAVQRQLVEATTRFAVDWFNEHVQQAVLANPAFTQEAGLEGLRTLKAELRALIERTPQIVAEHLDRDEFWSHRAPTPPDEHMGIWGRHRYPSDRPSPSLETAIRDILGHVGPLVLSRGLVSPDERRNWQQGSSSHPRYPYWIEWPAEMRTLLETYRHLDDQLRNALTRIEALQQQKGEVEAKRLWDQA